MLVWTTLWTSEPLPFASTTVFVNEKVMDLCSGRCGSLRSGYGLLVGPSHCAPTYLEIRTTSITMDITSINVDTIDIAAFISQTTSLPKYQ